ncbi:hypothetical protein [Massilia soli]|uniref:Exo-alpha-sialidase n=1 Tax=Massilia soli TaxID=2792854 RepID=A0ABS7SUY4_9BURK|nr:hypothetical protein [Massilia soli]MBZ2209742.1 hypothetical protein [Massilia soli]
MIRRQAFFSTAISIAILMLAGCGGEPIFVAAPVTRIDVLASHARGMENIVFHDGSAYIGMSNSATEGTAVVRTGLPVSVASQWNTVALGNCRIGPFGGNAPQRAPALRPLGDTLWLFQPWYDDAGAGAEHALCALNQAGTSFVAQDQSLRACYEQYCYTLWMDELKMVGSRLYSNAGAGQNLFVSDNKAASWRVLLGQFDAMTCYHQAFHVVGDRLLVGGECPLDMAYLRAYRLSADGSRLASQTELPVAVPALENRNIQFIDAIAGTQRVFAGVEGGLLRSDDGGTTFKFVIRHPAEGGTMYPYVQKFLSLKNKPNVIVVGGFDKANARAYLAWSADGGDNWTNLSSLLPGYNRAPNDASLSGQVTSLVEDPQGRVLLTLNEDETAKGKLIQLTLGKP